MRICRLDLTRYGKFTNQSLELPHGEYDFHLIYGPNEAGKSTIRNAVVELLYGINRTSTFNFIHEYSEMCIGALIEAGGESLDFQRLKRNKGSLVNTAGDTLPDAVLAPFLGGTERDFFLRMFALGHQNMVSGGREILNSSGDLGQMLFQAAAGLSNLQAIKEKLEEEAEGLWGRKAKESRAYNRALGRMDEAKSQLHAVRVTSHHWTTARRALETADEKLDEAQRKCEKLQNLCNLFERVQRVSPLLVQLQDAQVRLDAIGSMIRLPFDAAATLAAAQIEIAKAVAEAKIHRETVEDAERDCVDLTPDLPILSYIDEVRRLAGLVASIQKAETDIPKREIEAVQYTQRLLSAAKQVGWNSLKPEDVANKLPNQLLRAEIDDLVTRYSPLKGNMALRDKEVLQLEEALQLIDDEEGKIPQVVEYPALAAALKAAQALNQDERNDELAEEMDAAKRKLTDALIDLAPWSGDAAALALTDPPDVNEIQRILEARRRIDADLTQTRQGMSERQRDVAGLHVELQQERRAHHLATAEELSAARLQRDTTFGRIADGDLPVATTAPEYGEEVKLADTLADRRYEEAHDTAKLQALTNQSEKLHAEINHLEEQEKRHEQELVDLQSAWEVRAEELGLAMISLDRVASWTPQRATALDAASELARSCDRAAKFTARTTSCKTTLRTELQSSGTPSHEMTDLSALIVLATDILSTTIKNRTRRESLNKQRTDGLAKLQTAQAEAKQAQRSTDDWEADWRSKLAEANISADSSQVAVSTAMDLFRTMDDLLEKIRDLRQGRITPMRRDIDQFEAAVAVVVEACATDLIQNPAKVTAVELATRLTKAFADRTEHERLSSAISKAKASLKESMRKYDAAEAGLKPLFEQAGVSEMDGLRQAIAASDALLALDRKVEEHRAAAMISGGGMTLEELEKEVASVDLAQLDAQLDAGRRQSIDGTKERDGYLQQRALANAEYCKIAGTDEAAKAETRRQAALSDMGAAADEYIRVWTGTRMLKWALERYREEKQGPLLVAASDFFSHLTNGQHAKLLVDPADPLRLISRKADGSKVGVEGMSDGTSDQLYLALRLAALELHMEGGTTLPILADDLLINCDNERAASSLKAFARIGSKTQVLYFTHHRHLIEVARRASENRVNVIEIG